MFKSGIYDGVKNNLAAEAKKIKVTGGIAIVAGMVIGPGIFKTPSIVAANASNELLTLVLWAAGGFISFIGALCYAELTSSYPDAGGEYHYLTRSFGKPLAFLFAWARMTVIQTGSIAMLCFVIGDYASEAFSFGKYSSSIYAVITVLLLTGINLKGILFSSSIQKLLLLCLLSGILFIVVTGLAFNSSTDSSEISRPDSDAAIGQALIFILLTYGGWNEASYISRDISRSRKDIVKVLFYSIALISFTYLIINFSLINGLGFQNISESNAVAADLIGKTLGSHWVSIISIVISFAALSTVNAVMITGAKTNYALGRDFTIFQFMTKYDETAPVNAFILQSTIAVILILLGTFSRNGFTTMVEYTAPVFWFFFLLVGISLFILRRKETITLRPFSVPLYPVVPLLFCFAAAYMLYASLVYTGTGALIGIIVLLAGIPILLIQKSKFKNNLKVKL